MGEYDFQQAVLSQLQDIRERQSVTETDIKYLVKASDEHRAAITEAGRIANHADQSAKSAHHRIDSIFVCAGALGSMAGGLVSAIATFWPRGGGHG